MLTTKLTLFLRISLYHLLRLTESIMPSHPNSNDSENGTNKLDELYPTTCPFCAISKAFPPAGSLKFPSHRSAADRYFASEKAASQTGGSTTADLVRQSVPQEPKTDIIHPECHLVLSTPHVLAFLDIMPMSFGHLLVVSRAHRERVTDLQGIESAALGIWLPLLARAVCKTLEVPDFNIVQNNGIRAAQVVPHVHFHIIPRPSTMPSIQAKSWTMFGRGQREELDDGEAAELASALRTAVTKEIEALGKEGEEGVRRVEKL